jgi:hypothetical protein
MKKPKKAQHGGKREGSGRPPTVPDGVRSSVTLTRDSWARLRAEARRHASGRTVSAVLESYAQSLPES